MTTATMPERATSRKLGDVRAVAEKLDCSPHGRQFWHDIWLTPVALPMAKRDLAKLGATKESWRVAKLPPPKLPDGLPPMDDDAAALYDEAVIDYREGLRHAKPDHSNELGFIPLSASIPLRPKGEVKRRTA